MAHFDKLIRAVIEGSVPETQQLTQEMLDAGMDAV